VILAFRVVDSLLICDLNDITISSLPSLQCGDGFLQPEEECDDGNGDNGDGCSSDCKIETITTSCQVGEAKVALFLQADGFSYDENELYFFEANGQTNVDDIDFIWIGTQQGIENNKTYELTECVEETKCYRFYFFDNFGDGLWGDDGLRLSWNDVDVLTIAPFEVGPSWEGGPAVYWMKELGECTVTSSVVHSLHIHQSG
jgi:cysteine-rich repeat protein